jgi:hypothetical protein
MQEHLLAAGGAGEGEAEQRDGGPAEAGGHRLELDLPPAGALECVGDDSGECCTTEIPTGEIVAEGTLQPVEDSGGMWRLAGTQVCVVP